MINPIFPAVGADGKVQDKHLPDRLSDTALTEKIQTTAGSGGVSLVEDPPGSGLFVIGEK